MDSSVGSENVRRFSFRSTTSLIEIPCHSDAFYPRRRSFFFFSLSSPPQPSPSFLPPASAYFLSPLTFPPFLPLFFPHPPPPPPPPPPLSSVSFRYAMSGMVTDSQTDRQTAQRRKNVEFEKHSYREPKKVLA